MKKIFLIAGEASGDQLGAGLLKALRERLGGELEIQGVGGERMIAEGLASLFPMQEIALMGFAEILPHVPRLMKRIRQTVAAIETFAPDAVITIDSPGFNFRIAAALKEKNIHAKRIHYVAPTVWAYKPERASKTAKLFDHLLVLLPFEPPYFEAAGLAASFVGHPVADDLEAAFARRASWEIPEKKPLKIALLPGSRKRELETLLPVFRATLKQLQQRFGQIELMISSTQAMEAFIRSKIAGWNVTYRLISDPLLKQRSYYACDVALVKSGTIAIEVAKTGLPMVVTYKVHPLSAWLLKRMIKTPFVNLVNILAQEEVIPELLQGKCKPKILAKALTALIDDEAARRTQAQKAYAALQRMRNTDGMPASAKAANIVLTLLD